jgi:hypothetical protein
LFAQSILEPSAQCIRGAEGGSVVPIGLIPGLRHDASTAEVGAFETMVLSDGNL